MLLFVVAEILIFRLIAIEYSKYYFHHNKHLIKPEHDCQCECGKWEEKYEEEQKKAKKTLKIFEKIEKSPIGRTII